MQQSSALYFLLAAAALVHGGASQPKGDQGIAIAAVTEARDELKLVVQQLGQQQEQIDLLTKEVAELRAAKKPPTVVPAPANTNTSSTVESNAGASTRTAGPRKVLTSLKATSLRATAERAEHVLVAERPRTPWWAEKLHTKGPADMHREGGYYGEANTDATFGRQRYYPAGWQVAPEHQPIQGVAPIDAITSWNVFAPDVAAAPPAPSPAEPVQSAVPTLPPIPEDTLQTRLQTPVSANVESSSAAAEPDSSHSSASPPQVESAPPPPGGNELRPRSDQLGGEAQEKSVPAVSLKNTMGFFGPPPSGTSALAPAAA
jgi:hypothetical protein